MMRHFDFLLVLALVVLFFTPSKIFAQQEKLDEMMLSSIEGNLYMCQIAEPWCSLKDFEWISSSAFVHEEHKLVLWKGGCLLRAHTHAGGRPFFAQRVHKRALEAYSEMVAISAARAASECGHCPSDEFWASKVGSDLLKSGGSGDPKAWDRLMKQCRSEPEQEIETAERSATNCSSSSPYKHWEDLLNFEPATEDFLAEGGNNSSPDFDFQRLDGDYSDNVNLDDFSVQIDRLPPRFESPEAFFDHFRRNMNSFFDNDLATLRGINHDASAAWQQPGSAPVGTIHVFDIHGAGWGAIHEQGAVLVTRSSPTSWTFTTVTVDVTAPGEHPVSGHREFGIRPVSNGGYELYVRAADRVTGGFPDSWAASDADVIAGGKALWRSFQQRVADFVNDNRGEARINEPRVEYPPWNSEELQECVALDSSAQR